jgi:hypothetical protein
MWDLRMTYRPRLVAVNRYGQHFTLFAASNREEAEKRQVHMLNELEELSAQAWCDRYIVPAGFAEGSWRPGRPGHEGLVRRFLNPNR